MSSSNSSSIWARPSVVLFVGLIGAILGAVLSPIVTQYLSDQKQPVLHTEDRAPNLSGLDQRTLDQISLVPSTYFIRHLAGGQADNVAVRLESSEPLQPNSIAVDAGVEPFALKPIDRKHVQVDLPHMRPGTSIAITVTHRPSTQLNWKTISSNAAVDTALDTNSNWREMAIALSVVGAATSGVLVVAFFVGNWARRRAISQNTVGGGANLAFWIAFAIVVNVGLRVLGSFINVSSIPFDDLFYGLLIYLLVTNWAAINRAVTKAGS